MAKKFDINKIGGAAVGGVVGVMAQNQLSKMAMFQDKPKVPSLIVTAAGAGMVYFFDKQPLLQSAGMGMISVGSATLAGNIMASMNGFSRVNALNGDFGDEDMREILEEIKKNPHVVQMTFEDDMDQYTDDYDDGMHDAA